MLDNREDTNIQALLKNRNLNLSVHLPGSYFQFLVFVFGYCFDVVFFYRVWVVNLRRVYNDFMCCFLRVCLNFLCFVFGLKILFNRVNPLFFFTLTTSGLRANSVSSLFAFVIHMYSYIKDSVVVFIVTSM